ncbi:MAG TPA: hypothetical protein VGQ57_09460, partial [Polyangiaceae bacterium]|nr:hypothetical protein [Polyangiaceae bacterium]
GTLPPARRARPAMDMRGPWIGVAVAAAGLAAGFGLYLAGQNKRQIVEVPAAEVATAAPEARAAAPAKVLGAAPTPEVTPDMLPAERGARHLPDAPAAEAVAQADPAGAAAAKPSGAAIEPRVADEGRTAPGGEARAAAAPSGVRVKAEKIVLEEDHSSPGSPAAPPASGPHSTPGLKPAEFNANGGVADRPSTGAAQAAVGAVLGAARSCIAGQPQGSSATLVFGSSGEVTSVFVSGPAEGTPAAACIQSALKKARVQPFAAPSFSLGVTIRPL